MIESEEFYNIAQRYRHSDIAKPEEVLIAYQEMLAYIDTQIAADVSSAMVWQPMSQKPDECGWYLVWRETTQCQAEAYYDTDKGWMSAYSYTEGGCTKMYSDATHFMLIKPPEGS